jgi:ParB family transcriptional regulator, chromosome partitioning protein
LQSLADSIRQYGLLQALVVTRKEVTLPDGGLTVEYELIAGERRLRASKLAGIREVPCLIKNGEENDLLKLELAIIENVQREDLNPVDRAKAFQRLVEEFGFKHSQVGEKVGKSREYVSNSLRLLALPEDILTALTQGKITEGHARPLMMLNDRPEEQSTLFKEIMFRKITVREAEIIARKIAVDKVRKKDVSFDPEVAEIEKKFEDSLGTRVHIERREVGGKLTIDFFSKDDLRNILELINKSRGGQPVASMIAAAAASAGVVPAQNVVTDAVESVVPEAVTPTQAETLSAATPLEVTAQPVTSSATVSDQPVDDMQSMITEAPFDDRTPEQVKQEENQDIYSVTNFTI